MRDGTSTAPLYWEQPTIPRLVSDARLHDPSDKHFAKGYMAAI